MEDKSLVCSKINTERNLNYVSPYSGFREHTTMTALHSFLYKTQVCEFRRSKWDHPLIISLVLSTWLFYFSFLPYLPLYCHIYAKFRGQMLKINFKIWPRYWYTIRFINSSLFVSLTHFDLKFLLVYSTKQFHKILVIYKFLQKKIIFCISVLFHCLLYYIILLSHVPIHTPLWTVWSN